MFIWIYSGKYITPIIKKFICFFFWITHIIFENYMDTENDFENNILQIFINTLDDFLDLISSK